MGKNITSHKTFFIIITVTILVIFLVSAVLSFVSKEFDLQFNRPKIIKQQEDFVPRRLDGVPVAPEENNNWPVAIMIDNHPQVWEYQTGLGAASLVYSTLVEGGYTRLLAIYVDGQADRIGPVRSARPYFVRLARETNSLYAHSGGSPEAIMAIEDLGVYNLEEATSYGPIYIWRDRRLPAPHNLLTSSDKVKQAIRDWQLDKKTPDYQAWKFQQDLTVLTGKEKNAFNIFINYSSVSYFNVSYKFNPNSYDYLRSQGDQPHIDNLTSEQISVKNVIIQFVAEELHLDALDRLAIDLLGQGDAWIIANGYIIKGSWKKEDNFSRTIFYDQRDKEVEFMPGNIWVEIVPGNRQVVVE